MRFLLLIGKALAILAALVILLYLVALAINARDEPPSADFLRLKRMVADRPLVADADNGYVYVLGLAAAGADDPHLVGPRHAAWLEEVNRDITKLRNGSVSGGIDYTGLRSAAVKAVFESCSPDQHARCLLAFDGGPAGDAWSEADRLLLARYPGLIETTAWREIVPNDVSIPLPAYAQVMAGQRLLMLSLRGADVGPLREALGRDLQFWRRVLTSSDVLITKMIAVAAVRQNFYFGNLLLRRLPAGDSANAIPAEWRQEFTREELSMARVMAGELVFMEGILRHPGDVLDSEGIDFEQEPSAFRRMRSALAAPFYQPQDVLNHVAADHLLTAKAFEVPLGQYPNVASVLSKRTQTDPFPSRAYDLTGDYLRDWAVADYGSYALRIGTLEGVRRAALTTAELRARGVPASAVSQELAAAPLRNPFDGSSFAWDEKEQAVVYRGPEIHAWRRMALPY